MMIFILKTKTNQIAFCSFYQQPRDIKCVYAQNSAPGACFRDDFVESARGYPKHLF